MTRNRLLIGLLGLVLVPFDLVLLLTGPRYRFFVLLFRLAPSRLLGWFGTLRAIRAYDRAARNVPAYRRFLEGAHLPLGSISNFTIPEMDKENYIKIFDSESRCINGTLPMTGVAIDESSGSTGTPFNWVRSLRERHTSHIFISHFARYCYGEESWITVNAFSMGAWATGINIGIALQRNSLVKNVGPDVLKIFKTLEHFGANYRYLICGYPPFLKHLVDIAMENDFPLERFRLMALLGGEGNSEGLRDYLLRHFELVYSGYGATDIEIGIAGETPISVALRRTARDNDLVRRALFGDDSRLPMLFQYNPLTHHIVANNHGELNFTICRRNVLSPRVMYNIHDEGGIASYSEVERRVANAGLDLRAMIATTGTQPLKLPFLWVFGRKDSTISVMGANIYPEDIEQCLYDEPALARVTNSFCLGLREDAAASVRPVFSFEIRGEITSDLRQAFEQRILDRLRSLNADFRQAMSEFQESATPVVELFPCGSGPFVADAGRIKQARLLKVAEPAASS